MINKKIIYGFVLMLSCSSAALGINLRALDLNADSFNNRILSKVDTSVDLISKNLDFLDEQDEQYIADYNSSENDFNVTTNSNQYYTAFSKNCRKIYDSYAEIDKQTQVAVNMLFKEVSKKFLEHYTNKTTKAILISENTIKTDSFSCKEQRPASRDSFSEEENVIYKLSQCEKLEQVNVLKSFEEVFMKRLLQNDVAPDKIAKSFKKSLEYVLSLK